MGRSLALTVTMLLLSGGAAGVGWAPETGGGGRATDEAHWSGDCRLTNDLGADEIPELVFEDGRNGHLVWQRDGKAQMYQKFDENGTITFAEQQVSIGVVPLQGTGQPATRLAMGKDRLHAIWFGYSGNYVVYRAITTGGGLLGPVQLTPLQSASRMACLPVGRGSSTAIFAYEKGAGGTIATAGYDGQTLKMGLYPEISGQGATLGIDSKGYIHLFNRGPSWTGLYHTRYGSDGNTYTDTHSIDTDVAGAPPDATMPRVAFDSNGSIHLLQTTGALGPRSIWYTKLSNDGARLTEDLWICGTAGDFGDIEVDNIGNAHIVWGDQSDGQIHYLKIRPGAENRSWAPVALTTSGVKARDPDLDVGSEDRLGLVWADERDGNPEIYFKSGMSPGARMTISYDERAKIESIRPNETRSANFTVKNTGADQDRIRLSLEVNFSGMPGGTGWRWNGTGWKVWLTEESVDLDGQGTKNVEVFVRGPPDGNKSVSIGIRIIAASALDPANAHGLQLYCWFRPLRARFQLFCSDDRADIAGESARFEIKVKNMGDKDLTVELNATSKCDWNYSLDRSRVYLGLSMSEYVYLDVTPPANAGNEESATIFVNGRSSVDPSVKDSIYTVTTFYVKPMLLMSADPYDAKIDPGGTAVFNLTVANTVVDGSPASISLDASLDNDDPAWKVAMTGYCYLESGENVSLPLKVIAPAGAPAGLGHRVDVQALDYMWHVSAHLSVNVTVRQVANFSLAMGPGTVDILPAGKAVFELEAVNYGNGPETLAPRLGTLPAGWKQELEWAPGEPAGGTVTLDPGGTARCWLTVVAPFEALAGTYVVNCTLQNAEGLATFAAAEVRVGQMFRIGLVAIETAGVALPGSAVFLALEVTNRGNCIDTIGFVFEGLPDSWFQRHMEDSNGAHFWNLSLGPGEKAWIYAVVTVPGDFLGTRLNFSVRAVSAGGASDSVRLGIDVPQMNLVAASIEWVPALPVEGDEVTLTVRVANTGLVDVENVHIRLWEGDRSLGFGALGRVAAGDVRSLQFSWRPEAGSHRLALEVDPAQMVRETDERDNRLERTVPVSEKEMEPSAAPGNYWNVAAALVVLVAVAGLALLLREGRHARGGPSIGRRKRP